MLSSKGLQQCPLHLFTGGRECTVINLAKSGPWYANLENKPEKPLFEAPNLEVINDLRLKYCVDEKEVASRTLPSFRVSHSYRHLMVTGKRMSIWRTPRSILNSWTVWLRSEVGDSEPRRCHRGGRDHGY
jgi:hypothetical protein